MGVVEYKFTILSGSNKGVQWRIYDVGGARNTRQAWAPYFEHGKHRKVASEGFSIERISSHSVNAIIFLAPISAFDQVLAEVLHYKLISIQQLTYHTGSQCESTGGLDTSMEIRGFKQATRKRQHCAISKQV